MVCFVFCLIDATCGGELLLHLLGVFAVGWVVFWLGLIFEVWEKTLRGFGVHLPCAALPELYK